MSKMRLGQLRSALVMALGVRSVQDHSFQPVRDNRLTWRPFNWRVHSHMVNGPLLRGRPGKNGKPHQGFQECARRRRQMGLDK